MGRIVLCIVALVAVALTASPALAQKDPFDPVITEESSTTAPSDTAAPTDTTDETTTEDPAPSPDEPMPSTGIDPSNWIGVALLAIAMGLGFLALGRVLSPIQPARRKVEEV